MKQKIADMNYRLKALHRRFLENEKIEAEKLLERRLSSFDFLLVLTTDPAFSWMHPFSALIAEVDAFLEDVPEVTKADIQCVWDQVEHVLRSPGSVIEKKFQNYLNNDGEFILLHSSFHAATQNLLR